jgi:hypothetical protein
VKVDIGREISTSVGKSSDIHLDLISHVQVEKYRVWDKLSD